MASRATPASAETLQTLIGLIYDAAIDPAGWTAFLAGLADLCNGAAILYREDPVLGTGARLLAGVNIDPAWREPYETHYSRIKPWRGLLARTHPGDVVRASSWFERCGYHKSEYYNDCLVPLGFHYHLGSMLQKAGSCHTAVTLVRSYAAGDFTAEELALSTTLLPHIQRALRMNEYLSAATLRREAALSGLERLSVGVVLASGDAEVLFANAIAEDLLRSGDGLGAQREQLRAIAPALTQELHRRIREAADTGAGSGRQVGGALSLPRRSGGNLSLLICPFPIAAASILGPTIPAALLFVAGPGRTTAIRESVLQELYGLTAAEARLAGALLAGMSPRDYAAQRGISPETAKTQLRQIFAKTGQRRQADLIRHILSNPIMQLASAEVPTRDGTSFPMVSAEEPGEAAQ